SCRTIWTTTCAFRVAFAGACRAGGGAGGFWSSARSVSRCSSGDSGPASIFALDEWRRVGQIQPLTLRLQGEEARNELARAAPASATALRSRPIEGVEPVVLGPTGPALCCSARCAHAQACSQ